ncbi:MAG TPA: hypothetical protein VMR45_04660 [Patescibacteria group bacterium]|nr:hypothetical protein [Patescibacteria group bacterium]
MSHSFNGGECFDFGANSSHSGEAGLVFPEPIVVTLRCEYGTFALPQDCQATTGGNGAELETSDPTEPEDKDDHKFEISGDEVWQLGLTVSELIRHKWTGELPYDVERQNEATYAYQTAVGPAFLLSPAEARALRDYRDPCPEPPNQDLRFAGFPRYKEWALAELGWLSRRISLAASSPGGEDMIPEIVEKATLWREAYKKNFWREAPRDRELLEAARASQQLCRPILDSTMLSTPSKVELIDAVERTRRRYDDPDIMDQELEEEFKAGNTELCVLLLERPCSGEYLLNAMKAALPQIPIDRLTHIADSTLAPLAQRLKVESSGTYITDARREIEVLSSMLGRLDSPLDKHALEVARSHLPAVTRIVTEACTGRTAALKGNGDHIPHYLAIEVIELLHQLYFPKCNAGQQIGDGLGDFLMTVFYSKFDQYMHRRQVQDVGPTFNRLASACGLEEYFRI